MAGNIEQYMRLYDSKMGEKYQTLHERINKRLKSWKGKLDGEQVIDIVHEIMPLIPPNVDFPPIK